MIKVLEPLCDQLWMEKGERASYASKVTGNLYTGSLYLNLISYLSALERGELQPDQNKLLMFSFGSGSMSTMFSLRINTPFDKKFMNLINNCNKTLSQALEGRIKVHPKHFHEILRTRELSYSKLDYNPELRESLIRIGSVVLTMKDKMGRRYYERLIANGRTEPYLKKSKKVKRQTNQRLLQLSKLIIKNDEIKKENKNNENFKSFHKRTLEDRIMIVKDFFIIW